MKTLGTLVMVMLAWSVHAESYEQLMARGDSLDAQLKSEQALKVYLEADQQKPNNAELLIKIAKQYGESMPGKDSAEQKKAAEQALEYAKRAVKLEPKNADAHLALSICYGRITDFVSAKTKVEYSRIIFDEAQLASKLDPKADYAWHIMGRWHYGVATLGGLTRGIVKIVYGGLPAASLDEAKRCFEKASQIKPDRLCHVIELGRTLAEMGKKEEARKAIEQGLAMENKERDDPETKQRGRKTLEGL